MSTDRIEDLGGGITVTLVTASNATLPACPEVTIDSDDKWNDYVKDNVAIFGVPDGCGSATYNITKKYSSLENVIVEENALVNINVEEKGYDTDHEWNIKGTVCVKSDMTLYTVSISGKLEIIYIQNALTTVMLRGTMTVQDGGIVINNNTTEDTSIGIANVGKVIINNGGKFINGDNENNTNNAGTIELEDGSTTEGARPKQYINVNFNISGVITGDGAGEGMNWSAY